MVDVIQDVVHKNLEIKRKDIRYVLLATYSEVRQIYNKVWHAREITLADFFDG